MATINDLPAQMQNLDLSKVKAFQHQLDDVMEIIDTTELQIKLREVEENFNLYPAQINKVRLGIIYHETALNLGFLKKSGFKGYSKRSYDILNELYLDVNTTRELLPFVSSYRASALALAGGETMKLGLVGDAFHLFQQSISEYGHLSSYPEFLRGSVSENLPWFFFSKRKYARKDMQSIIDKQNVNNEFANWRIMSFTYWAWANQRQNRKYRAQSLDYLDKAIALDPNFKAGRQKAEDLKNRLRKKGMGRR